MFSKKTTKILTPLLSIAVGFYASAILAADAPTAGGIGSIANTITGNLSNVLKLLTAASYLAGFGLVINALFRFKKHHESPQGQETLSSCIMMLLIGIALIFLPSIISTGGATLGVKSSAGISGIDTLATGT